MAGVQLPDSLKFLPPQHLVDHSRRTLCRLVLDLAQDLGILGRRVDERRNNSREEPSQHQAIRARLRCLLVPKFGHFSQHHLKSLELDRRDGPHKHVDTRGPLVETPEADLMVQLGQ